METSWESELANFLTDLSNVQGESLDVLARKRELLAKAETEGLAAIGEEEENLIQKLQACLRRREELLKRADDEGLPSDSLRSLTAALPDREKTELADRVNQAAGRARLLQHHSLTNWVLVQRTLIHLSQLLEIIATGGRIQPTYGAEQPAAAGALVDRVA